MLLSLDTQLTSVIGSPRSCCAPTTESRERPHLPLLHQRPEFVCSHGHTMKVGEDILALYIFRDQSELPEGLLVILQVSQRYLKHTSLQAITGEFLGVTQDEVIITRYCGGAYFSLVFWSPGSCQHF